MSRAPRCGDPVVMPNGRTWLIAALRIAPTPCVMASADGTAPGEPVPSDHWQRLTWDWKGRRWRPAVAA